MKIHNVRYPRSLCVIAIDCGVDEVICIIMLTSIKLLLTSEHIKTLVTVDTQRTCWQQKKDVRLMRNYRKANAT